MTLSILSIFEKKDANASLSLELVSFNEVQNIIKYRCGTCHAKYPTFEGIEAAPKGVVYDTAQDIVNNIKLMSKIFLTMAMAAIGLSTNLRDIKKMGYKPFVVGFLAMATVGLVCIGTIEFYINFFN